MSRDLSLGVSETVLTSEARKPVGVLTSAKWIFSSKNLQQFS